MKIVAVIENKGEKPLHTEHGLCVYIEYRNKKYLLDSGSSNLFLENAKALGIDLEQIDKAILSHAHFDHSGGYEGLLEKNARVSVYVRDKGIEPCYVKVGCIKKYVGIPKKILAQYSNRFKYISGKYELDLGVWLIPHTTPHLEIRGKKTHLARKIDGKIKWDDFAHEQSLVFECAGGLVVLNSCSHGGVDHIIQEVQEAFPKQKVMAMIGGFHLMGAGGVKTMQGKPEEIRALGRRLNACETEEIYTGHCTGDPAYKILKEELGEKLHYFSTGTCLEFAESAI